MTAEEEAKHIAVTIKAQLLIEDAMERNDNDYRLAIHDVALRLARKELEDAKRPA